MINFARITRVCLWSLIGFLTISALVAVVSLLSGNFGDTQIKVLLTTLTISGASVCGMACAAFIEKRKQLVVGGLGIGCAAAAAGMAIFGIWAEQGDTYMKYTLTMIIASAGLAHICLLHIPVLSAGYRWSQSALTVFVGIVAVMVDVSMWKEINDSQYYRILGVVSVVVVLLTLVVPICAKLGSDLRAGGRSLALSLIKGDIYEDEAKQQYRVTKI